MARTRRSADAAAGSTHATEDEQVREMVADPETYFAKARAEARREARVYVATREQRIKTA